MAKLKLYVTVTNLLGINEFEMTTDADPTLPWHDFIEKIQLHKRLDKEYPDWQGYDINIDECDIVIEKMFGKMTEPTVEDID